MKRLNLNEIKNIELEILVAFDSVCREHNLRYGLSGGTLLGAIRHEGFIPWDDDIDVVMPRPDYEKLIVLSDKAFGNKLFFSTPKTDSSTVHAYGKLFDMETELIEFPKGKRLKSHVYIDIFPLDGLPADVKKNSKHRKKVRKRMLTLYAYKIAKNKLNEKMNFFKRLMWRCICIINALLPKQYLNNRINRLVNKYEFDSSEYNGMIVGGYGDREVMEKDVYVFDRKVVFEGKEFSAPNKTELYLERIYGDYMKLPPEEDRHSHDNEAYVLDSTLNEI